MGQEGEGEEVEGQVDRTSAERGDTRNVELMRRRYTLLAEGQRQQSIYRIGRL